MHILIRLENDNDVALRLARTIFLRPTPWKVAWQAGFAYIRNRRTYGFAYIPTMYTNSTYEYLIEGVELLVHKEQDTIFHTPIRPLTFRRWFFYGLESFAYGFFERFWAWRWDSGTLTRTEMQAKIEVLEQQIQEFIDRQ